MPTSKEHLTTLFNKIGEPVSDWFKNATRLYEKSRRNDLTSSEKSDWQKIQIRNYIDFADTIDAQIKTDFLKAYLEAEPELQQEFHRKAVDLFTAGQFAVISVRLNSLQILDLGMDFFIVYLSKSHDYNLITELKLIYTSAKLLNKNPDSYLQEHLSKVNDNWALSFIEGYLSQGQREKLRSGY
jgi:hypothetical protein